MKLHVFFVLSFIFILFSCANKVDSIDVKNLKTPCECAHAAEIVINEQIDIREETIGKDFKDLDTSKLMPRVRNYMKKKSRGIMIQKLIYMIQIMGFTRSVHYQI